MNAKNDALVSGVAKGMRAASEDQLEGPEAFGETRKPDWKMR